MKKKDALEELRGYMQTKPRMNARMLAAMDVALLALERGAQASERAVNKTAAKRNAAKETHCCVNCGAELPDGWKLKDCEACREEINSRQRKAAKAMKKRREEEHRCLTCGTRLPEEYKTKNCLQCRLRNNERLRRYVANRKEREKGNSSL